VIDIKGILPYTLLVGVLIFSALLALPSISESSELKKIVPEKIYHPKNKTIEIRGFGKRLLEVQLVKNTDVCFQRCEAIIRINTSIPLDLSKVGKKYYKWSFYDKHRRNVLGSLLEDYWIELRENQSYNVSIPIYETVNVTRNLTCLALEKVENSTNLYECYSDKNISPELVKCDWIEGNTCYWITEKTEIVGYRNETRYREVWRKVNFYDLNFEPGRDYYIKLVGIKRVEFNPFEGYRNDVEWVSTIYGLDLDEWAWWNTSWPYRQNISITGQGAGDLTDYQIKLELNSTNVGANFNWSNNGNDLRFTWLNTTSNTEQEINYWIESWSSTAQTATVWIKVPFIGNTSTETVYMYYGNPDATSESNQAAVCPGGSPDDYCYDLYDDFEDGVIDTSKWETFGSGGTIEETSGYFHVYTNNNGWLGIRSKQSFGQNYVLEFAWKVYGDRGGQGNVFAGFYDSSAGAPTSTIEATRTSPARIGYTEREVAGSWPITAMQADGSNTEYTDALGSGTGPLNYPFAQINWTGSSSKFYLEMDGSTFSTTLSNYPPTNVNLDVLFTAGDTNSGYGQVEIWVYWIRVRKFADPEPTYSIGAEEISPPPVVESVRTYNETYGNQTTFYTGDKVVIRANITHPLGNQYVDSAVITIIDNASTVQVNNESMTLVSSFSAVYPDWSYRRAITIAEQSGSTLTDFQVAINVTYDSKMQADFDDLRFTWLNETSGEEQVIPYWIEDKVNGSWAYVWVKVPEIPASGTATVYMYYGNPSATSESNGTAVFEFFDDFEGTSLDTNKWTAEGTPTVSDSIVTIPDTAGIKSTTLFSPPVVIESKTEVTDIRSTFLGVLSGAPGTTYNDDVNVFIGGDGVWYFSTKSGGTQTLTTVGSPTYNEFHLHKIVWTSTKAEYYYDRQLYNTSTTNIPTVSLPIWFRDWGADGGYVYVDWVFVRKFADPEPTYSIGTEEQLKLTFEYNYTIPTDAVGGTWRAIVYANNTYGNWGSNETTFEVIADIEPPTITFVSQVPANLNESSYEPVSILINITDPSGVNESRIAFFHGVNHTLGTGFYHYNWSWRYPANDLQPDMRRADFRNMSYWFEEVVFKESPDDIWTFAGYDKTIGEVFKIIDSGVNYTTVNITFFSAQMLFPQIFPFDKYYLTKENKTNQYVELYNNQWMKLKFYPKMFYNYTQENYTIYLDLNVDPSFTPNTRPLEIYFCNSSYTTGDPSKTSNCAYVEEIDSTDTRTIVIANSSYIQNVFYIADGYIDGVKVTDEAYLVLRTTAPPTQAFRLHYADDVINEYINFTNFGHAWVSSDNGNTWNPVSYTPDFYLIATQAERDKVMYYVYACDNYGNCANSTIQYDSLDPVNHPPGEPLIIEPAENATLTGLVNASWLTIGDPDFDPFNASIHLFYPDGTYFTTIAENIPGSNQQYNYTYEFNTSLYPTGTYRLNVTLCDSHGLCSSSITPYNFTIYHVYEQPLEQGMTTSAYLRRILGKGQIVAVIVYDYLARTFMGYREILTVTSVTEALRIVLVRELEELFTINIGFVEIPIKNLPVALTTTTELSTWFKQLRYLSDQLATSLTLAMEVVTLRVGEVSFSVSEAVARAVNMVRVSDLPVLISESLVKTIEVVREAEIAVTLAESLGKWIGVARIGEVAILVTDVMIRSINVAREMVAYLTSTVLLTVTRMETFLAQITVSDAVARVVIAVRPVVETISLILRFTLEYPAIPTFLLPAPPYALFAWATNIETLFVLLVAISVAIIVSTVYVFNKRHELFEHPTERFFGKKKKKR